MCRFASSPRGSRFAVMGDSAAVHALDGGARHRRQAVRVIEAEKNALVEREEEMEEYDEDADDGVEHMNESDADDHDGVTFVIVAAVLALVLGLFWFLFVQMTAPSELLTQRLQSAPRVEAKHVQVHVDLSHLYTGYKTTIDVDRQLVCRHCAGSGMDVSAGFHKCHECQGSGVRTYVQRVGPIQQHVRSPCSVCKGRGQVAKKSCDVCQGRGMLRDGKMVDVVIERGMRHGDTITLPNAGDQSPRKLPGDVVVHVVMQPHASFTRRGDDLELELKISLLEALVGFSREITHLDGRTVTLSRNTVMAPSTVWRIRGQGMPMRGQGGVFGDLLVRFRVKYPTQLSPQEKKTVSDLLSMT